jgi:hypothetical protein
MSSTRWVPPPIKVPPMDPEAPLAPLEAGLLLCCIKGPNSTGAPFVCRLGGCGSIAIPPEA